MSRFNRIAEDPKDAALKFVNELRGHLGAEPLDSLPPGKPKESVGCPVYNGLKDVTHGKLESVGKSYTFLPRRIKMGQLGSPRLPFGAKRFIRKYDKGAYPELNSVIVETRRKNVTQKLEDIPVQESEVHVA